MWKFRNWQSWKSYSRFDKFENIAAFLHNIFVLLEILLFSLDLSNICIQCHCCTTIFKWKYLFEYWILMPDGLVRRPGLYSELTCHQMIYKLPTIIPASDLTLLSLCHARASWHASRASDQPTRVMMSRWQTHNTQVGIYYIRGTKQSIK